MVAGSFPVPGQQLVHPGVRHLDDAREDIGEPALRKFAAFATDSSMQAAPANSPIGCARWGWRCEVHRLISRPAAQSQHCESAAANVSPVAVNSSRSPITVSNNVSR